MSVNEWVDPFNGVDDTEGYKMWMTYRDRIAALEAELAEAKRDSALLDTLEKLIQQSNGGLLIHHQIYPVVWNGVGLGLSARTLRKAIDGQIPMRKKDVRIQGKP